MKLTVTDVRQSRVKLWANTFNVNIRDHEEKQFEHGRYYLAAEVLARNLTSHPTMTNRLLATHTPEDTAQSGIWLGTSSCAFKKCAWECNVQTIDDRQARDDADHPLDQSLKKHICQEHGHTIKQHLTTYSCSMSSHDELRDTIWAVYTEAVGVQERKRYPVMGPSVD